MQFAAARLASAAVLSLKEVRRRARVRRVECGPGASGARCRETGGPRDLIIVLLMTKPNESWEECVVKALRRLGGEAVHLEALYREVAKIRRGLELSVPPNYRAIVRRECQESMLIAPRRGQRGFWRLVSAGRQASTRRR
ncbi:MAG: hypothetical protein Q8P41_18600 [Pseudomonadota bacterium]|nr:hypothetical protein [Pseudomonadota bacterium]